MGTNGQQGPRGSSARKVRAKNDGNRQGNPSPAASPLVYALPEEGAGGGAGGLRVSEEALQLTFPAWNQVAAWKKRDGEADNPRQFFDFHPSRLKEYDIRAEDALKTLGGLGDGSVGLVLTSPPYNIGKEYETQQSIDQYLAHLEPILAEIVRVVADGGSVCWETGNYVHDGEVFPLDIYFYPVFKRLGLKLRNRIIWHFGHGLHCSHRFSGRYETILWFTKGDRYTFNLDDVRIPSKYPGKRYYKGAKKGQLSGNPLGKNPEDAWTVRRLLDDWDALYWDIPNVKNNHPEKVDHPCQFPVELCERCVLALTREDDLVYDPFCGVASTLIAALKNGRRALGSELEPRYVAIGNERIRKLAAGELALRPISQEIYVPPPTSKLVCPTP